MATRHDQLTIHHPPTTTTNYTTRPLDDLLDRVVVRPSGTEPKLKCYCEVVMPVAVDEPVEVARRAAAKRLENIKTDLRGVLGI
ncbi:Hypothetical protein ACGLYG10_0403 [Actinomyces glycerinitolerans]|uniref:Alpha-D-phosphohexomutase C-terminal domain-containing protein n=1 Tax=Actinomyces glycerinitolerans TaxID=1892869 RepID=A0A1M4RW43_9ACTO|nr:MULTISPECIES: hypothetical protein [Actinomyces]SHE24203.1 Hypothetical protein ACGLYG10_0403 [Actinomyces glycerinitolerans]